MQLIILVIQLVMLDLQLVILVLQLVILVLQLAILVLQLVILGLQPTSATVIITDLIISIVSYTSSSGDTVRLMHLNSPFIHVLYINTRINIHIIYIFIYIYIF